MHAIAKSFTNRRKKNTIEEKQRKKTKEQNKQNKERKRERERERERERAIITERSKLEANK